jgi:lipid-A-disaccharide synthase
MAGEALSLFILAGEPSGDRIGAALIEGLRRRTELRLAGVGGSAMAGQGLQSLFPMSDLSVMGFSDVARRLPLLLWRLRQTARAILRQRPDLVVLIDSQVFSAAIAKRLRRGGFAGRIVLYVAPAVWAWKPERAPGLKALFDEVLAVLPFEPAAMVRLGGPPTAYVGHPAVERFLFRSRVPDVGPLLLLPGSRNGEIRRTLTLLRQVAETLKDHPRLAGFVLPTPAALRSQLVAETSGWSVPVRVVSGEAETLGSFAAAVAAVAVTGTVTLELALAGVPTISTYVADAGQAKRFARYKVKFVALPNIILDRPVVPEMLFSVPAEPERLVGAVRDLLDHPAAGEAQHAAFRELRSLMETGAPEAPIEDAAGRLVAALPRLSGS